MDKSTCSAPDCTKPRKTKSRYCSMHGARVTRHGSPEGKARRRTLEERVLAKVRQSDGCWQWDGWHNEYGYAALRNRDGMLLIHRFIFELANGPIPDGCVIDHACHNRECVNPRHLRSVTRRQNVENFTKAVPANNTSGYRGAVFHRQSGLWNARVWHVGRNYSAGYFKTAEEAGAAAQELRCRLFTHNDLDRGAVVTASTRGA